MSFAMFNSSDTIALLNNKIVWFCGDSNMRAIYKDLLWLSCNNTLIPQESLKMKNEESFLGDTRLTNSKCHNGTDYEEMREFFNPINVMFMFLTRIKQNSLLDEINCCSYLPDIIILNSCVWDLTRWGPSGVSDFKSNVHYVMRFLKNNLSERTRIIFLTTFPVSNKCRGGFVKEEINFTRSLLPWHVIEANHYIAKCAKEFEFDVIDVYYHLKFMLDIRANDGIHWLPKPMRFITNLILTHIALCENFTLPRGQAVCKFFLESTHGVPNDANTNKGSSKIRKRRMLRAKRRNDTQAERWSNKDDDNFIYYDGPIPQLVINVF